MMTTTTRDTKSMKNTTQITRANFTRVAGNQYCILLKLNLQQLNNCILNSDRCLPRKGICEYIDEYLGVKGCYYTTYGPTKHDIVMNVANECYMVDTIKMCARDEMKDLILRHTGSVSSIDPRIEDIGNQAVSRYDEFAIATLSRPRIPCKTHLVGMERGLVMVGGETVGRFAQRMKAIYDVLLRLTDRDSISVIIDFVIGDFVYKSPKTGRVISHTIKRTKRRNTRTRK